ncbi:MAG: hypothetical protein JSW11_17995 [Candidatus Heimdallarchaeota archaeon]|nr:MAG: hypothetical protein JSW11_17995 [Candidatus Heimdallarchaeota archaeon]
MARHKIRKKKPRDNIKSKIPVSLRVQEIKQKTPTSFNGKSFELPPPKARGRIPKDGIKLPSKYGSSDQTKKESIDSNVSPPINNSLPYETKSPTNIGLIPKNVQKKSQFNKKTPTPKQVYKIGTIPRSTGVVHSKKELSDTINKPPPPKNHKKMPQDTIIQSPTMGAKKGQKNVINQLPPILKDKIPKTPSIQYSTKGGKKKQKNVVNQPPPPKIHIKSPVKKKVIPPPIFNDIKTKIPKTRVKTKKPK